MDLSFLIDLLHHIIDTEWSNPFLKAKLKEHLSLNLKWNNSVSIWKKNCYSDHWWMWNMFRIEFIACCSYFKIDNSNLYSEGNDIVI